jgi:hypothetical protein
MNNLINKINNQPEWFVLRGEMKYGPFEYRALIEMNQTGELFDYNYIWAPHLENWTPFSEVPDFSPERIRLLIEAGDDISHKLKSRSCPRTCISTSVYAHNDRTFFEGQTVSVSEGGALITLNNPLLIPSEKILIHFRKTELNNESFNLTAEVIRKNYSKHRLNIKSGLNYTVRFLQVKAEDKEQITKWSRSLSADKGE